MAFTQEQYKAFNELYERGSLSEDQTKSFETLKDRGAFDEYISPKVDDIKPTIDVPKEPVKTFGQRALETAEPAVETLKNIGRVYPALETAANLVTSTYGIPASGVAGLMALPFGVEKSKKAIEATQKALVYEPQTEKGAELTEATAYPFTKLEEGAEAVGKPISEAGYPKTATALHTAITGAPAVLGARKTISKPLKAIDAKTKAIVRKNINKAVRPAVAGKRTASQTKAYYDKATTAVEEIVRNKENLDIVNASGEKTKGLPKTLDEFSQAVEQTKRNVFTEYDALAKKADILGDSPGGIKVNLDKTATKLDPVLNNKILKDMSPETIEYAKTRIESLKGRKNYTALETQEAIQFLNQTLENFYRDPTPALKGKALVDSMIANDLRAQLDASITKATGKEYSQLKKAYGALKTIEKDVNRRAIVDSRKNNKGLIDFSDIFTGGHVIAGMLRSEPAAAAGGLASKGIASYYKMLNDPNKMVKTMFKDVEALGKTKQKSIAPATIGITGTAIAQNKEK
ncbi:MAG: hypothetical protein GY714_18120 [Desulfobacterales bacterium]|nr:hypothetical protein [Desulfobacterales bacterium]